MSEAGFHFAQPIWLLALLLLVPVGLWLFFSVIQSHRGRLNRYADEHLLPHLTGIHEWQTKDRLRHLWRWALLWFLAVLAMAGPRWDFTEIQVFRPGSDLVILMDISRSMEVADVQPTRLGRARQEIQDLVSLNRKTRVGLIAFASVAHIVTPITEDGQSILNALPGLSTELVRLQGSRLYAALDRAEQLLAGQPKESVRSILLISDGDFDEPGLDTRLRELNGKGIRFYVLGIGSPGGGPVPGPAGDWLRDRNGAPVESRLNPTLLEQLTAAGGGVYLEADFRDDDSQRILELASARARISAAEDDYTRVWNERFYWLLLPLLALLALRFRKRYSEAT